MTATTTTTTAVRYFSKTGHTKQVADIIAQELGVNAAPISEPLPDNTNTLFLGGAFYGFGLDEQLKAYIKTLDPTSAKMVYVFATSALLKSVNQSIKNLLQAQGLTVAAPTFYCHGKFKALYAQHPSEDDLKAAAAFAKGTQNDELG